MNQKISVAPVSKAFYFGTYLGGSILGGILMAFGMFAIIGGAAASESGDIDSAAVGAITGGGLLVMLLGLVCLIACGIVVLILYYKMWAAIQDGHARTTPGKAVGFMFIPLFNLYWMFQAIWGYSKDYNEYLRRYSIPAKPLPEGLFLTACILPLLGWIPFVGSLVSIANLIILIIIVNFICNSINALATTQPQQATVVPEMNPGAYQSPIRHTES